MPTIKQLPTATAVTPADVLPVSQNGLTRGLTIGTLLSGTEPALSLAQGTLLGRVSAGQGGPEPINVGVGLTLRGGAVAATGDDHAGFPAATSLQASDEVIVNSNASPKRVSAAKLRSLFSAGTGVAIDDSGVISVVGGSGGPGGQGPKGDTGPQGPAGQGFTFRGVWQASTAYSPYDVVTYVGQTYVATTSFVSGSTFSSAGLLIMAAQGATGLTGTPGPAGPVVPASATSVGAVKPGAGLSVAADGTLNVGSISPAMIAQSGATLGQLLGWTGTAWTPTSPTAGATYSGASPVSVGSGVISLAQSGAAAGQVLAWNGTAWAPQSPVAGAVFGSGTPAMDGVASSGSSSAASRDDHRHPTDTTRAPLANPAFTGSITLPTWTTSSRPASPALGMEGFATDTARRETYTAAGWVQYVRLGDIPAANGQLLGGAGSAGSAVAIGVGSGLTLSGNVLSATATYTLSPASTSTLGGVKQGAGVTIGADGTISATGTSGVSTLNGRSGAVSLTLADLSSVLGTGVAARSNLGLAPVASSGAFADLAGVPAVPSAAVTPPAMNGPVAVGTASAFARADHVHPSDTSRLAAVNNLSDLVNPATARSNLGLGGAATLNVGTTGGTVAAGNDTRITAALQPSAIPSAAGQLLGGSGTAGAASAITLGTGLSLSSGTLSAPGGGGYTLPAASTTALGGVKPDGSTVSIANDGTLSVVGVSITALTDISSGNLGGPAPSDVDTLNRGGTDYRTTLAARSALFRKTPAGSRTVTLVSGSAFATLTAADNDKTVVVSGSIPGSLTVDGTVTDGFRCQVINHTGSPLSLSGITGLGATSVANGNACWVTLANSTVEAALLGGGTAYTLPAATSTTLGGVKPDGTSLTTSADGTLSVVTVSTSALAAGGALAPGDKLAIYSIAGAADVAFTMGAVAWFAQSNFQSWTTAGRPSLGLGQYGHGFNTTLGRFDFWNGTAWNQHVRVSDFTASASQLYAGSATNGVATPVNIGANLTFSGGTLSAAGYTLPVATAATLGGVKQGSGITIAADGTISAGSGGAGTITGITAGTGLTGGGTSGAVTLTVSYGTAAGTAAQGNDSRIVGAEQVANKGAANGYASLDGTGKVPSAQLPAHSSTVPVTTANSGASQALALPASGSVAYDITLTGNCTFTLSGGTAGQLQLITLVIRGGAGGFTAMLPSGVKWPGGTVPTVDTSAGSYNEFYLRTLDGGSTYSGNY